MHELKTYPSFFEAIRDGIKTFEIRRDDRGFQVGDWLHLMEWNNNYYTGEELMVEVTYLTHYAQRDDYVVMGIVPVKGG